MSRKACIGLQQVSLLFALKLDASANSSANPNLVFAAMMLSHWERTLTFARAPKIFVVAMYRHTGRPRLYAVT